MEGPYSLHTGVRRWVIEPMQVPIIETRHNIY